MFLADWHTNYYRVETIQVLTFFFYIKKHLIRRFCTNPVRDKQTIRFRRLTAGLTSMSNFSVSWQSGWQSKAKDFFTIRVTKRNVLTLILHQVYVFTACYLNEQSQAATLHILTILDITFPSTDKSVTHSATSTSPPTLPHNSYLIHCYIKRHPSHSVTYQSIHTL